MLHSTIDISTILNLYKDYYQSIKGGIDGYYEKTILDADCYSVKDSQTVGYFTIHKDRGLTSLLVLDPSKYNQVFDYVISLPLVTKILFTENDKQFMNSVISHNLTTEKQAINFEVDQVLGSKITMKKVEKYDIKRIYNQFKEFIDYNNMDLSNIQSFYYEKDNKIVSFGALEPMALNQKRYCLAMIVNDKYRRLGYGQETVKYLINYLDKNTLETNARCYIINNASKATLLASGLKISNYLYKVEEIDKKSF